ncbi:D-alanyl-D-alanine carboxypeptidase family protein [Nocardia sp. NPDC051750]|uniref:D-alanyl-D-alanine carboxypeptidase family protein n=1 Tax=Nocardia sp. NPDC051750 TaxID=3364325 RepID=UPI0037998FD3
MYIRELHQRTARRFGSVLTAAVLAAVPITVCGPAIAQPPPPTVPPFVTPVTDTCPQRTQPPPAIDASEVPEPGDPAPTPLAVPDPPIGGKRLGECGVVLPSGAPAVPPDISATAWMVSDLDTGAVLAAKDPHGRYRPASTIKVLLATVALRTLDLDKIVVGTQADADVEGTRVGIGPGGRYTNRQLLHGLVMASGNDAAHAIAAQLGGDEAAIAKMNDLAKSLHAYDTRAATPSGLDGPGMSTSAYDLSLLFREAMSIPLFAQMIGTEQLDFPGYPPNPAIPGDQDHPGFPIANDNGLLYNYPGALGGKTGYTDDARQTFVAAAERDGRRLSVTLLQADVLPIRPWEQAARLLDYGFGLGPEAKVGDIPGDESESGSAAPGLAAPPGEGDIAYSAQPAADSAYDELWMLLMVAGLILVPVLLVGTWHIRTRRH